ncbi:hypothetical protein [Thiohalocapsa marina]|uniref:hypothetical protein n=1 Tax=Thiohalocapsa marina TaxID=424902 RepID=UPI0036DC53CD
MAIKLLEIPAAIIKEAIASEQAAENLSLDRELLENPRRGGPHLARSARHRPARRLSIFCASGWCVIRRWRHAPTGVD